jgi:hypothetical protein
MSALRRTKIGDFSIENALQWEDLRDEVDVLLAVDPDAQEPAQ